METRLAWTTVLPKILTDLREHGVAVVLGDTGMGKSTDLPRLLLEAKLKKTVSVFVPRRTAAKKLASYAGRSGDGTVGYLIGQESMNEKKAKLMYLTTAMLGKTLTLESWAKKSIIVIDECMKADIDTHTCFALAKEVHRLGGMVVLTGCFIDPYMIKFFNDAPVSAEVRGTQYPVTVKYSGDLYGDMPKQAANAVKMICSLPTALKGHVLIFVAGLKEMEDVEGHLAGQRGLQFAQLRSSQPQAERDFAFAPAVPGITKIILATEVAEESVTIDGAAYVIDTLQKKKLQVEDPDRS